MSAGDLPDSLLAPDRVSHAGRSAADAGEPDGVAGEAAVRARLGADELGLKKFDANHDILLEPAEAGAAADAFRKLADANADGRVTPQEYQAARADS